jgi:uncharacterized protein YuzE
VQVIYDSRIDTVTINLRDAPVSESDEKKRGIILDYDAAGNVVSLEILDASELVTELREVVYRLARESL